MTNAVLDSSFIVSLFFRDRYTVWAHEKIKNYKKLITLDLAFAEVANVAWKRIFLFKDNREAVLSNLKLAVRFMNTLDVKQTSYLIDDGINLALNRGMTFYDASFVILAMKNDAALLTTDLKLANAVKGLIKIVAPNQD